MKVEYEYFSDSPSLFISGSDFLNALDNEYEYCLLKTAVEGYYSALRVDAHFSDEANDIIKSWIGKSSKIIYTVKKYYRGKILEECWGEVYVSNNNVPVRVIFKEAGNHHHRSTYRQVALGPGIPRL